LGESWINYFDSDQLRGDLSAIGFTEVEDLGPREIAERYFPSRPADAPAKGGHLLRAVTR